MTARSDFWSRRKAAVLAEDVAERDAVERADIEEQQAALEEKSDAEILEELSLPDPDAMEPGDDFSAFMKAAVPERLRRRALRRLWLSNPLLANVDGLVDYGEDFTDSAMVVESLQTAYQVGKGMLKHVEALAAAAEAPEDVTEDVTETEELPETPDAAPATEIAVPVYEETEHAFAEDADEAVASPTRRMRFAFAEDARTETRGQV